MSELQTQQHHEHGAVTRAMNCARFLHAQRRRSIIALVTFTSEKLPRVDRHDTDCAFGMSRKRTAVCWAKNSGHHGGANSAGRERGDMADGDANRCGRTGHDGVVDEDTPRVRPRIQLNHARESEIDGCRCHNPPPGCCACVTLYRRSQHPSTTTVTTTTTTTRIVVSWQLT